MRKQELADLIADVPEEIISDYETRRQFNVSVNLLNIRLTEQAIVDFSYSAR